MNGFAEEILRETEIYIDIFASQLESVKSIIDLDEYEKILVSGAGDSYAAAITGIGLAGMEGFPVDPRELGLIKGNKKTLVIAVSLGGRTGSLVSNAKRLKETGAKVIGVTGNIESPLAKISDEIVRVTHNRYIRGSGFGSYISLTAAVTGILNPGLDIPNNFRCTDGEPGLSITGTPFFVGEDAFYGLAVFSMLKFHEDLGIPSRSERLEQFMHAPVFSLQKYEQLIILAYRESIPDSFLDTLIEMGHEPITLDILAPKCADDKISSFLISATQISKLIAQAIEKSGLEEPFYRLRKDVAERFAGVIYTEG